MVFTKNKDKNFIELLKGSSISLFLKVLGMAFGYSAMLFVTNYYGAGKNVKTWEGATLSTNNVFILPSSLVFERIKK